MKQRAQRLRYLTGDALHRRILQACRDYLQAKADQNPLVLVWDDLHWADPSSLALLEALLPLSQQCPLLLLLVYRPIRNSRLWTFHQKLSPILGQAYQLIELGPLTRTESAEMLHNLLENCQLPDRIQDLILTKAEGNPFFLEEVVRSLIDRGGIVRDNEGQCWRVTSGLDDITIPDTLQGVIMARIDQLEPRLKRILQVASVIGRDFSYPVLDRVLSKARR